MALSHFTARREFLLRIVIQIFPIMGCFLSGLLIQLEFAEDAIDDFFAIGLGVDTVMVGFPRHSCRSLKIFVMLIGIQNIDTARKCAVPNPIEDVTHLMTLIRGAVLSSEEALSAVRRPG